MPFIIQSIILFKTRFTKENAIKWLKKNNYKYDIDEKDKTWWARQKEPSEFDIHSFKIHEVNDHLNFVIGGLKYKKIIYNV